MKKIALGHVLVAAACLCLVLGIGIGVGITLKAADASRNSAGTMANINGPFTAGQVIASSLLNNRYSDIETEITNSLDRSGRGGMLAALRGIDGTLAAPAFSWTSETGSGYFRNGAGDVRLSILGALVGQWTANGLRVASGVVATPGLSFTSETGTGWYRAAAGDIRFAVSGVDKQWLSATGLGIGAAPTYPLDVQTQVGATHARFVNSTNPPVFVYTQTSNSDIGFNLRHDGTNIKYDTTNSGALWQFETTGPALVAYTAPSGTAGNTATVTERFRVSPSGLAIGGGTAISASYRGTVSWTPGSIISLGVATNTITLTGAAAGADCMATNPSQNDQLILYCTVTLNTCNLRLTNPTAGAITGAVGTYACRVWNP